MFVLLKHRSPEKAVGRLHAIPPLFSKVETEFTSARLCETLLNTSVFGSSVEQEKSATALRFHSCSSYLRVWRFQPSGEAAAESSFDRPSRHGKRAHEGGGNVALLYGDFEFLACLALQEEAFVRELQLCIPVKTEILQASLNPETAARSSKLFYYFVSPLPSGSEESSS